MTTIHTKNVDYLAFMAVQMLQRIRRSGYTPFSTAGKNQQASSYTMESSSIPTAPLV